MVIYTREKKTLIIPEGLQGGSADCKDAIAAAYASGITVGYGQGYEAGQAECSGGTDCSSAITEAYQSGYTAGVDNQRDKLVATAITANGLYERTDGFCCIDVQVPTSGDCSEAIAEAYQSGHTGGVNEQKAKLESITITANTTVTREDGWSSVTVNVHSTECNLGPGVESLNAGWNGHSYFYPSSIGKDGFSEMHIYDNGYGAKKIADGKEQQKALLGSTAITQNGTYTTNGNGWSSVTVNVASAQSTTKIWMSANTYADMQLLSYDYVDTILNEGGRRNDLEVTLDGQLEPNYFDMEIPAGTHTFYVVSKNPSRSPIIFNNLQYPSSINSTEIGIGIITQ